MDAMLALPVELMSGERLFQSTVVVWLVVKDFRWHTRSDIGSGIEANS